MSRKGVVVLSPVAAPDGAAFDAEIVDAGARRMMLLDSNILIYATYPSHAQLRSFIAEFVPFLSIASCIEVLGHHRLSARARRSCERFFSASLVLPVSVEVAQRAVGLRQRRQMSLGDAIIAGTAPTYDLTLVTHNTEDFGWISGMEMVDPLE